MSMRNSVQCGMNMVTHPHFSLGHPSTDTCTDNLQVQWGSQDHYEIVRKVGRGKYSEVGPRSSRVYSQALIFDPTRYSKV